jgi:hypothetical protein
MAHKRGTYLEGSHRKGINITRSRRAIGHRRGTDTLRETFRGHISRLMVIVHGRYECACDPKVSKIRLTIPSNQDVALDVPSVSVRDYSFLRLPTGAMASCEISNPSRCIKPRHTCASYCWRSQWIVVDRQVNGQVPASAGWHPGSSWCTVLCSYLTSAGS